MKLLKYNLGILLCLTAIFFIACDSDDETIQQNRNRLLSSRKSETNQSLLIRAQNSVFLLR